MLVVAWIDGYAGAEHNCEQSLFVAASNDGGRTFSAPLRVSDVKACKAEVAVPSSTSRDYFGFLALPDGRFRMAWGEMPDGVSQLMTAIIGVRP